MVDPRKKIVFILKKGRAVILLGCTVTSLLALLCLNGPTSLKLVQHKVFDILVKPLQTESTSGQVVIVDIDEKSLNRLGQWPWPRYRIGTLLEKLKQAGASSIGLDVLFPEADRTSIAVIKKDILQDFNVDIEINSVPQELRNNDTYLSRILRDGPFVPGFKFLNAGQGGVGGCILHPVSVSFIRTSDQSLLLQHLPESTSALCNIEELSRATTTSGFINASPDLDGTIRKIPLLINYQGKIYPSLALATYMLAVNPNQTVLMKVAGNEQSLRINDTVIPLSEDGGMLVRFRGKGRTFPYISAADILSGTVNKGQLKGKIVLIGSTATGVTDRRPTPVDPLFPGVEVHATVVDNIIQSDILSRPGWAHGVEFFLVLMIGIFSTLLLVLTNALWSMVLLGLSTAGIWHLSAWSMQTQNVFISPVFPLLTIGFLFLALPLLKLWQQEHRVRQRTRELARTQEATFESLLCLAETRDPETGGHIKRTQEYIVALAKQLRKNPKYREALDDETIDLLYKSAPLHDIGKVGVSDRILLKPGKLSEEEFEEIQNHTLYGRDVILSTEKKLGRNSFLRMARDITYSHHEKWDGSCYPEGLKGEEIPLAGRLMAVADVYDALISKRVYKRQLPHEKAVQIITNGRGTNFDPAIIDAFLAVENQFREIALKYADQAENKKNLGRMY